MLSLREACWGMPFVNGDFMEKIYLMFIFVALFSFGCIDFNFEPSISITVDEEEEEVNDFVESEIELEETEKKIYEILEEKNNNCFLNDENEMIEIILEEEKIEIVFEKSNYFVNTESIICLSEDCIIYLDDFSKEIDYDFLKTFALIYEDFTFKCLE